MRWLAIVAAALSVAGAARAEVVEQSDTAFRLRNVAEAPATPAQAYAALGEVGRWWSAEHTYSGKAANLSLPLEANACFCERWPGGGVVHGTVVLAWPDQGLLRLAGGLGPLQEEGLSAALTFQIRPKGGGVEIVQTYSVGGARPGLPRQYAPIVDQVLREALTRYAAYLRTGKPE